MLILIESFFSVLHQDIIAYMVPKGAVGYHYHNGPLGMDFRVSDLSSYQIEAPAGILKDNSLWGVLTTSGKVVDQTLNTWIRNLFPLQCLSSFSNKNNSMG